MARGAWKPRLFKSYGGSYCTVCGGRIEQGKPMILSSTISAGRKKYHFGCFEGEYKDDAGNNRLKTKGLADDVALANHWRSNVVATPAIGSDDSIPDDDEEKQEMSSNAVPSNISAEDAIKGLASVIAGPISQQLTSLKGMEEKLTKLVDETEEKIKGVIGNMPALTESAVEYAVKKYTAIRVEIKTPETQEFKDLGLSHELLPELLQLAGVRMPDGSLTNIWIAGPAGSGKTKAAQSVAEALGLPFYFEGAIADQYRLSGYKDAQGQYVRTLFREAYEHGGVFLQDECDGSDANATLWLNAALANGHCAFPDKVVPKHNNCLIIAAANTWGHGANDSYVGRNKLDGAFLDRFIKLPWHVDEKLERAIAQNDAWVDRVQSVRRKVSDKGIKVHVTPRASIYGAQLLSRGFQFSRVEELVLRNGMTPEQWSTVNAH